MLQLSPEETQEVKAALHAIEHAEKSSALEMREEEVKEKEHKIKKQEKKLKEESEEILKKL